VITQDNVEFYVKGLRLTGTRQELVLREAGTQTWLPLTLIQNLRFTGPEMDRYRPVEIMLTTGEKVRGNLFVDCLLHGATDLGYWNMPLRKVERLEMGTE
jgi:hypothetical protein